MDEPTPKLRLRKSCAAPPVIVYDTLADLQSHLEWGGARQIPVFRLSALSAAGGAATVGTVFTSTGTVPMSRRHWEDRSEVTVATRPSTFEFVTDARAGAMVARLVHRYEIAAAAQGSIVTYTLTEERVTSPMLRFAIPGVRSMTWLMARFMFGRGLRNLLTLADTRATRGAATAQARA